MFRIVRVPPVLDQFFCPLQPCFHGDHWAYFRLLVLVMAFAWGRRNVANLYRYLDPLHHRTRFNNFFLVARWAPEAALRQKAQELLRSLRPRTGETLYLLIDDSKKAKRGRSMEAVGTMKDPTTEAYIHGHQYVGAILVFRDDVIPYGIRLYVKPEDATTLGLFFYKTTQLAAQLIREFQAPVGVQVMVLFDTYYLCRTVVKACREQRFAFVSTLKSHRNLFKVGWQLKAGRYGRNLLRRRRTERLVISKPYGSACYRFVDAGWLEVSALGKVHVAFSRQGSKKQILGLVTDAPELSAADLIRTYEKRWTIEQFWKDAKQLLGLGQYQNRSYRAAVIPLHLVCCAYALLTHLCLQRAGAQGRRRPHKAAGLSTTTAQEQLRGLLWDDLIAYLKETHHEQSVLKELERLRVA
jgi:SRSO17 transposase